LRQFVTEAVEEKLKSGPSPEPKPWLKGLDRCGTYTLRQCEFSG